MLYKLPLAGYKWESTKDHSWGFLEAHARGGGIVDTLRANSAERGYLSEKVGDMNFIFALMEEEDYMLILCKHKLWKPTQLEKGRYPGWSRTI